VRMAVLSNKPDEFTRRIVAALCDPNWFSVVRGIERDADRKPSPRLALMIAAELGAAPRDVYLIGDSAVDVETARAAGMCSVAVTWGFRDQADLRGAAPDTIVSQPQEIALLLGSS